MYVVLDEKPFVMGESQAFDHFVRSSIQTAYRPISWGALKKSINSCFTNTYIELLNYLTGFRGHVSVTYDLWRSLFQESFLSVTYYWTNEIWNMQKIVIAFEVSKVIKIDIYKKIFWRKTERRKRTLGCLSSNASLKSLARPCIRHLCLGPQS